MKNEEAPLRDTFRQMMDEEFNDIPSFDSMIDHQEQKQSSVISYVWRPILRVAAIALPVGCLAYYFLFKEKELPAAPSITNYEMASNQLLPTNQQVISISTWQSPTGSLLNNNFTKNEK